MTLIGDYQPILEDTPNQEFQFNQQLEALYDAARNISLTSRNGAIQNLDKAGNILGVYVIYTSNAVTDTQDTVAHNLGFAPHGYIVINQNKAAGPPYISAAFDATNIYLKTAGTSVTWTLLIF